MYKDLYREIKTKLKNSRESTRYFTLEFLELFVECRRKHDFAEIYNTDFYNKNSCAYCVFLEIYNEHLKKYAIYGYVDEWQKVKLSTIRAENEEEVEEIIEMQCGNEYKYYEFEEVM